MIWKTAIAFLILFFVYQAPQLLFAQTGNAALFVVATLCFLPAAYGVARWISGKGWDTYFLPLKWDCAYLLGFGIPLGLAASALGTWIGIALHYVSVERVIDWRSRGLYLALVYGVSFVSSAAEDIVTRGFLLRHWPRRFLCIFVPVSALVYVLNHIFVLAKGPSLWSFLYSLGFALAWPLWKSRQMWLSVGVHWGWNITFHTVDTLFVEEVKYPAGARWGMAIGAFALAVFMVAISRHLKSLQLEAGA